MFLLAFFTHNNPVCGRVVKGLLCVCTGVQLLRRTFYTLSLPWGCPSVNIFLFVDFAPLPLSSPRVNFSFLSCLGVHQIHDINYGVIAVGI